MIHTTYYLLALAKTSDYELGDAIPIGIIEFDDQGTLQSRKYKNEIMKRIRGLTDDHDTLTVVFAHGWLNNASPKNDNLKHFHEMLKTIATADRVICEKRTCEGRKVVGVYLAWRGMSAKLEPFKSLSFWNRKKRAHLVGQDGATEVLAELAKMKAGSTNRNSRLILIGHSFGGALIYSATQQLLMKDMAFVPRESKSVHRTIADLVILVNPAFEAARFTSLHEKAAQMAFPKTQSPILAIFTSEADKATKLAFPLGREISTFFTKYNPRHSEQKQLDRIAIGHYSGYQTHELFLSDSEPLEPPMCEWEKFRSGKTDAWNTGSVTLERKHLVKEESQRMSPYYNVVVDRAIIASHSEIWKPKFFMDFISYFVMVQGAKPCSKEGDDQSSRQ